MYKKCVYIVPVNRVSADLPLKRKKRLLLLKEERCIQNVYRSFLFLEYLPIHLLNRKKGYQYKRNVVYKMCIHRSCLWSTCSFTFETEKRLLVL